MHVCLNVRLCIVYSQLKKNPSKAKKLLPEKIVFLGHNKGFLRKEMFLMQRGVFDAIGSIIFFDGFSCDGKGVFSCREGIHISKFYFIFFLNKNVHS